MSTMDTGNVVQTVKAYLSTHHMVAYESWISGCVDYYIQKSETLKDIKNNAYHQWILHDLKYISPGALPNNLAHLKKLELKGNFVLQINSAIDIGTPKYQQYLKIKKTDTQNIEATTNPEEKISNKRMLKFELTDGKQTIAGMEYETLTVKTEKITPGCKVLIKGPVTCRLGMLLLTNNTMELLGGEVQTMLQTNSLIGQLASTLNLPLLDVSSVEVAQIMNTFYRMPSSNTAVTSQNRSRDGQNNDSTRQISNTDQRVTYTNTERNNYGGHKNEKNLAIQSGAIGKRQSDIEMAPEKRMKFDEEINFDDHDWGNFDEDIIVIEDAEPISIMDDDDDDFEVEDLKKIEDIEQLYSGNSQTEESTYSSDPFVYIKQINDLSQSEKNNRVFRVKAQIQNVLTKLTMTAQREWNLKCTIIDGTGCMDVEFSSDILSDFLGYTPESIREIKKEVATNPGIKNEINLAYIKTAETLKTLYCIMELTMYSLPKITRIIDYEDSHIDILKKRLQNVLIKTN